MDWLVDEWHDAWKWLQTQLGFLIAVAPQLYDVLLPMQSFVPPGAFRWGMTALGVLVMINSVRKKA